MRTVISMAAVVVLAGGAGHGARANADPRSQPVDSGRYGVEATCEPGAAFLSCGVSIRDLVYDTVLVKTELGFAPAGALGSRLVFDGNPAKGPKQTVAILLDPAVVGQAPSARARARFSVEVTEGKQIVQTYAFVVPVAP